MIDPSERNVLVQVIILFVCFYGFVIYSVPNAKDMCEESDLKGSMRVLFTELRSCKSVPWCGAGIKAGSDDLE